MAVFGFGGDSQCEFLGPQLNPGCSSISSGGGAVCACAAARRGGLTNSRDGTAGALFIPSALRTGGCWSATGIPPNTLYD